MFRCQNLMWNESQDMFRKKFSRSSLTKDRPHQLKNQMSLAEKITTFNDRPLEIAPSLARSTLFEGKEF